MRSVFVGAAIDEAETDAAIARAHAVSSKLIDPHTAVALAGAEVCDAGLEGPVVVLSTAHAAKFPDAVRSATGVFPPRPEAVSVRADLPERIDRLPADETALKAYLRTFAKGAP